MIYEPMFSRLLRVDGLLLNHDCTKYSIKPIGDEYHSYS